MGYEVQAIIKRKGIATLIRGIWYTLLVIMYITIPFIGTYILIENGVGVSGVVIIFILSIIPLVLYSKIIRKRNRAILNIDYGMNINLIKGRKHININLYERQNAKKLKVINYTYSNRIQIKIKEYLSKYKVIITGDNSVRQSLLPILSQHGIKIIEIYDEPSDD